MDQFQNKLPQKLNKMRTGVTDKMRLEEQEMVIVDGIII